MSTYLPTTSLPHFSNEVAALKGVGNANAMPILPRFQERERCLRHERMGILSSACNHLCLFDRGRLRFPFVSLSLPSGPLSSERRNVEQGQSSSSLASPSPPFSPLRPVPVFVHSLSSTVHLFTFLY